MWTVTRTENLVPGVERWNTWWKERDNMQTVKRAEKFVYAKCATDWLKGNMITVIGCSRLHVFEQFNKLTSVFDASVLLLIMNFVITPADYFDYVVTKCIVNNRTDALKTDSNLFFTETNCRISRSHFPTCRTNFKFTCLSAYWQ